MHVMQLCFSGYMNGHSSHFSRLNYGCKIECLQWECRAQGDIEFRERKVLISILLNTSTLHHGWAFRGAGE